MAVRMQARRTLHALQSAGILDNYFYLVQIHTFGMSLHFLSLNGFSHKILMSCNHFNAIC